VFFRTVGYLITGLLVTEVRNTGDESISPASTRGAAPPAAGDGVMVMAHCGRGDHLAPQELALVARAAQATAVYVANVFSASMRRTTSRRCQNESDVAHVSLAVEEQFYLLCLSAHVGVAVQIIARGAGRSAVGRERRLLAG